MRDHMIVQCFASKNAYIEVCWILSTVTKGFPEYNGLIKCLRFQEEIRVLRQRQKEAELSAEQERHLRTKISDDGSALVKENSIFNQQVLELTKQLERVGKIATP